MSIVTNGGIAASADSDNVWRPPVDPGLRLLLIDDDEDEHQLMRRALGRIPDGNYWLDWTPSYDTGLAAAVRREHDAYLVDQRLGSGTGIDLIREAKAGGVTAPLILLTGSRDPTLDSAALDAGAADFLVKGQTDPVLLDRTVRYAIAHARLTDELRRSRDQVLGLEEVAQLLADEGPTDATVSHLVRVLGDRFGYGHVSIFLSAGAHLRLIASRGYAHGLGLRPRKWCDRATDVGGPATLHPEYHRRPGPPTGGRRDPHGVVRTAARRW